MFGVKLLVWLNAITSRLDITQLSHLSSSPFLPLTKKTTPTAAAAAAAATAAAPTMVKHDLAEDNVVRGSRREEEEGGGSIPPLPPPFVLSVTANDDGTILLPLQPSSSIGLRGLSARLENGQRKKRTYSPVGR